MSPVEVAESVEETASENPVYEKDGKFWQDDTLSFKVPDNSPVEAQRGKKVEVNFTTRVVNDADGANAVITEKEWNIVELVNDKLRAQARSNAYQAALAPHKPTKMSREDIGEVLVRNYIRLGFSEEIARNMVEGALKQK